MDLGKFNFLLVAVICAVVTTTARVVESPQNQYGNRDQTGNQNNVNPGPYNPWAEFNPFSCRSRPPGYYADYSRACQRYYRCVQFYPQPFQFECGEGTRFNEAIKNCDWPERVDCY